ncbi:hypothetical protein [Hydrogenophaga sp.]
MKNAPTWPGTTIPISRGNGFDLAARAARGPSIFCNSNAKHVAAGALGGASTASTVAVVAGLSTRAQKQLKATGVQMSVKNDPAKTRRISKAAI